MCKVIDEIITDNIKENTPLMETMRANLTPKGTEPVVRLSIINPYFDHDFVRNCLDEMELKLALTSIELESPSALERLAIAILKDSADIA